MAFQRAGQGFVWIVDIRGLERLGDVGPQVGRLALEEAAIWGEGVAKQNIRQVGAIDTSFMINTTKARRISDRLWSLGTAAFYGIYVEFGTRYMPARPWLVPAVNRVRERIGTVLREQFRKQM
jgi:HK97 gp10 family phage protein